MSTPNMSIIILFSDQDTKDVFNPSPFCQILMRSKYIHFVEPKDPGMELSFRFHVWVDMSAIVHDVADTFMKAIQHNRCIDVFLAAYQMTIPGAIASYRWSKDDPYKMVHKLLVNPEAYYQPIQLDHLPQIACQDLYDVPANQIIHVNPTLDPNEIIIAP